MTLNPSNGKAVVGSNTYVSLDALSSRSCSSVRVMVCRKWDVTNSLGKYRSTDFVVSDESGNAIQCFVRSNISHCFVTKLIEGRIYSISNFSVVPNKDKYRVRKNDPLIIELEGYSTVTMIDGRGDCFDRFPFQLVPLEDIVLNESAYLIDVIGCVIECDSIKKTQKGTELLDCYIINERGTRVRVTLWGNLCSDFLQRQKKQFPGIFIAIFPSMHIKEFRDEVYLSSTSATILFDAADIPQIAQLNDTMKGLNVSKTVPLMASAVISVGSLSEILRIWRAQKTNSQKSVTMHCTVTINNVRTKNTWFYHACGNGKFKKATGRKRSVLWCDVCNAPCEFPRTCYRLHVDVADSTCSLILTLFDEIAETLLKKKAATLLAEVEDNANQSVLPHEIQNLVNTRHIFELRSHTYFNNKIYESFTASKLLAPDNPSQSASHTPKEKTTIEGVKVGGSQGSATDANVNPIAENEGCDDFAKQRLRCVNDNDISPTATGLTPDFSQDYVALQKTNKRRREETVQPDMEGDAAMQSAMK